MNTRLVLLIVYVQSFVIDEYSKQWFELITVEEKNIVITIRIFCDRTIEIERVEP